MSRASWPYLAATVAVVALAGNLPARAAIYGTDDRLQLYEETDDDWRTLGEQSIVMKLRAGWGICDGATVSPTTTLGEYQNLCEGEAYIDDPVLASCSATLVDSDLIVIARHCVLEDDACATASFVPGPRRASADELVMPGPEDIYACRRVVAELDGVDIAFVQLDRPVDGMTPATLGPTPELDAPLGVLGFPTGTPMKVARACNVRGMNNAGLVQHDCDTFMGNSGSGVFDAERRLWGVHVNGPGGDYDDQGDCKIAKLYTQDGQLPGIPSAPQFGAAAQISDVLPVLCESGWPTPLCGTEAACGDGTCSGTETASTCAEDCTAAVCGDGVCEVLTELECAEDCAHLVEVCGGGETTGGEGESSGGSADDTGTGGGSTDGGTADGGGSTTSAAGDTSTGTAAGESSGGAGADGGSADGGGCSCTASPDGGAAAAPMLVLVGLAARRRRRSGAR